MNKLCLNIFIVVALLLAGCKSGDKTNEKISVEEIKLDENLSKIISRCRLIVSKWSIQINWAKY
ncbi:Uncharacterised protein [Sphingobacterium daejeonense]|nr:Uncharacterised protein [Sphingobacterium daejeonense]